MVEAAILQTTVMKSTLSSTEKNELISSDQPVSSTGIPLVSTDISVKDTTFGNDKGYYIDDVDDGLNDLQVLFLACFATLIPLIISVVAGFGIRMLWVKYSRRRRSSYDGMLERDGTSGLINKPLHSHLLNSSDKVSIDTHLDIDTEEMEICDSTVVNTSQVRSNHSSTNGSIITMTLKNNHLIVETEERNDIEADSRETTMKYSPGARDGIFIVEVQQGVKRSPTSNMTSNFNVEVNQCALVHKNAADSSSDDLPQGEEDDDDEEEPDDLGFTETTSPFSKPLSNIGNIKTGLTQSNSSLARSYCYTNQQCYDNEGYGYNLYKGYINDEPPKRIQSGHKLRITAALYKDPSRSMDLDAPADGFLLSDVAAASRNEERRNNMMKSAEDRREGFRKKIAGSSSLAAS